MPVKTRAPKVSPKAAPNSDAALADKVKALLAAEPVRSEIVSDVSKRIKADNYDPPSSDVAKGMMEFFSEKRG